MSLQYEETLVEGSLNRMFDILKKYQCVMISAFREHEEDESGDAILGSDGEEKKKSRNKNLEQQKKLKQSVRQYGYAYIQVKGAWENVATGQVTEEDSLLVINAGTDGLAKTSGSVFLGNMLDMAKRFNQEAIVFSQPPVDDAKGEFVLYGQDGDVWNTSNSFSIDGLSDQYSKAFGHDIDFRFPKNESVFAQNFDTEPEDFCNRFKFNLHAKKIREANSSDFWSKRQQKKVHEESQRKKRERYEKYIQHVISGDVRDKS
jgi:hypothetical protein